MSDPVSGKDSKERPQEPWARSGSEERETLPPPTTPMRGSDPTAPEASSSGVPEHLGRYVIRRLLGRGGMGSVYLAHDTLLERQVALKVPKFSQEEEPELLKRFYQEARIAARLKHPNICTVYDVGEVEGHHLLSMAYLEGQPLSAKVQDYAKGPVHQAIRLVRTLALALEEAHRQGVIHRDLKPGNVMLDARGEPVVMDFGLGREVKTSSPGLTGYGRILGTPSYMAPEQARGDTPAVGPASDIYSLGIVLYELLVGRVPFVGPTMDVLMQQVRDQPPALGSFRPELDSRIEAICLKAIAKEPSRRFLTMADFARALEDYLNNPLPATVEPQPDQTDSLEHAVVEALFVLRTWSWEFGIEMLECRLNQEQGAWANPLGTLVRWLKGEASLAKEVRQLFRPIPQFTELEGWALVGQAYLTNRRHHFSDVLSLLDLASQQGSSADNFLRATIAHQRGFYLHSVGLLKAAMTALHEALDLCGREHFLTGVILDTLGQVHAKKNNLATARECFVQAIQVKQRFGNKRSISRSYRRLGRVYLDWRFLDEAEEQFQAGLQLSLQGQDERGRANSIHYLGRVFLARGEQEALSARQGRARRHWSRARELFDASIQALQDSPNLAHSHRNRGLLAMLEGDFALAESHLERAATIFEQTEHADGLARVKVARGLLARQQGRPEDSERLLRAALTHFDHIADTYEAARTQLEIARTLNEEGAVSHLTTSAYRDALRRAEACRRTHLVRQIEEELKGVDEEAHWQHIFARVRGRCATVDTSSLTCGESEMATALFLNLQGFVPFCQGLEPEQAMQTLNQLLADLARALAQHEGHITSLLGGGFMAVLRGFHHAERAVQAALDLFAVVDEFNRPRAVLGLQQVPVQIGIASGSMYLGNVGTYARMDFTAIGPPVNLAARLMRQAIARSPCISQATRELIGDRFAFAPENPRTVDLRSLGRCQVWDVIGSQ
jgi:serine/threonine protein kinase/class 3 adenylate cyclase